MEVLMQFNTPDIDKIPLEEVTWDMIWNYLEHNQHSYQWQNPYTTAKDFLCFIRMESKTILQNYVKFSDNRNIWDGCDIFFCAKNEINFVSRYGYIERDSFTPRYPVAESLWFHHRNFEEYMLIWCNALIKEMRANYYFERDDYFNKYATKIFFHLFEQTEIRTEQKDKRVWIDYGQARRNFLPLNYETEHLHKLNSKISTVSNALEYILIAIRFVLSRNHIVVVHKS